MDSERPDASIVIDDPDCEYDEGDEVELSSPGPERMSTSDELSVEDCKAISSVLYKPFEAEGELFLAFNSSLNGLLSGSIERAHMDSRRSAQTAAAATVISSPPSPLGSGGYFAVGQASFALVKDLQAAKHVAEMSKLSAALEEDDSLCPPDAPQEAEQVVEHGAPITLFQAGAATHAAHWDGQMMLQVNPAQQRIEFRVFRFQLALTPEDIHLFDNEPRSKRAMRRLFALEAQFSVSHVFRATIPLATIGGVAYHQGSGDIAALTLHLHAPPTFESRRVNCNEVARNAWRAGLDFTKGKAASTSGQLSFSSSTAGIQTLIGLLQAGLPSLASGTVPFAPAAVPPRSRVPAKLHSLSNLEHTDVDASDSDSEDLYSGSWLSA
eukprot:m.243898 g.243898  ORF g.243898 m.243898 type:complete len:382 (+) comp14346_c0_seq1:102-1247(+)